MTPQTSRHIARSSAELLHAIVEQAVAKVKSLDCIGRMQEAEVNARIDREVDRLIACAAVVASDQLAVEIATLRGDR